MKPRLKFPAQLTTEDEYIWGWVHGGWYRRFGKFPTETFGPDRRDADLMWKLSTYTKVGHPPVVHIALCVDLDFNWSDLSPFVEFEPRP